MSLCFVAAPIFGAESLLSGFMHGVHQRRTYHRRHQARLQGPNLNARPTDGVEGALLAMLDRFVAARKFTFYYDIDTEGYMFDHLTPLVRVLPGQFVRVGNASSRAGKRLREAEALGFPGIAKNVSCDEMETLLTSRSNFWTSLKSLEDCGCGSTKNRLALKEQVVRLWHGIDCLDPALISGSRKVDPDKSVFRGRGARGYMTRYPPLSFSRALFRGEEVISELIGGRSRGSGSAKPKPVVVWAMSDWSQTQSYLPSIERLSENYTVVLDHHPTHPPFELGNTSKVVQLSSFNWTKFDWQSLAHAADVLVTDGAGSSLTTFAMAFDKPLVVGMSKALQRRTQMSLKKGDFLDDDNAVVLSDPSEDVGELIERALKGDAARLPKRRRLFGDLVGCLDGYEEYRVAFQILRRSLSAAGEPAADLLEPLYKEYGKLPTPRTASGINYSARPCDPRTG